jgi:TonB family protein
MDDEFHRFSLRTAVYVVVSFAAGAGLVYILDRGCGDVERGKPGEVAPRVGTVELPVPAAETGFPTADSLLAERMEPAPSAAPPAEKPASRYDGGKTSRPEPTPTVPRTPPGRRGQGLPPETINKNITQHLAGIQNEYHAVLKNNPSLGGGKITVRFTVSPRGDVTAAEVVDDSVGNPALSAAVLRRVRGWKFPQADAETTVVYPFVFAAGA